MMHKLIIIFISLFVVQARSGIIELGVSGNYRQSYYGYDQATSKKSFNIYKTVTGSLSYYFAEQSAIEFSYTDGVNDENRPQYKTRTFITVYGMDFMYTLIPGKTAPFQPYIKIGAAYQKKKSEYLQSGFPVIELEPISGWSPSAGIGLRIILGDRFVIRTGAEAISSPIGMKDSDGNEVPMDFDIAARFGISWMF